MYLDESVSRLDKRQTSREVGAQSHGSHVDRQAAEVGPSLAGFAFPRALPYLDDWMTVPAYQHAASPHIAQRLEGAVDHLVEARRLALECDCDPWQFAVELPCLLACEISKTDLRWMVFKGFVDHAHEVTLRGAGERRFEPSVCLHFSHDSCFVLTSAGVQALRSARGAPGSSSPPAATPQWVPETRELLLGDKLVKRFRRPAANQELVLATFEEDRWPARIDDPLPQQAGKDPKRRLHDTINALNRHQQRNLVRFFGDGTGEGLCWELRAGATADG